MTCNYNRYDSKTTNLDIPQSVNSKDEVDFAMFFTLWAPLSATTQHVGKAGGHQILRCWGLEVKYYDFALRCLDSEALRLLQRWGLGTAGTV